MSRQSSHGRFLVWSGSGIHSHRHFCQLTLGVPQFDHFSPTRYEHALSQPIVIMLLSHMQLPVSPAAAGPATGSPAPGQIHLAPQMEISSREKCLFAQHDCRVM